MEEIEVLQNRAGEIVCIFRDELLSKEQADALLEELAEISASLERLYAGIDDMAEARAILEPEYVF